MHFGFVGFGMILFGVALIAAIIVLVKVLSDSPGKGDSSSQTSVDVLKEQYAAAEITRSEFEEMKRDFYSL